MDKITDFFKEIGNRLKSPFISSFIISWLIVNWRVTIGLIFYKFKELPFSNYTSYIDLIEKNFSNWKYLWTPLLLALAYTFLYPLFRIAILGFDALVTKWSGNLVLYFSEGAKVPMEKFTKQIEKTNNAYKQLDEIIANESEFKEEVINLKEQLHLKENEIKDLKIEMSNNSYSKDVNLINGKWQKSETNPLNPNDPNNKVLNMVIGNGRVVVDDILMLDTIISYNMTNFFYTNIDKKIFMIERINYKHQDGTYLRSLDLTVNNDFTKMTMKKNDRELIVFSRIDD
ncbi:hypothetical protein ACFOWM_03420 [Ferruginibacter yonginensis]|uniref:Uncharacterized protein n=1 Tax=Ferruginibacter yonginensis TaxID=1310416 RepID=A0ABV8QRA7_9BACT